MWWLGGRQSSKIHEFQWKLFSWFVKFITRVSEKIINKFLWSCISTPFTPFLSHNLSQTHILSLSFSLSLSYVMLVVRLKLNGPSLTHNLYQNRRQKYVKNTTSFRNKHRLFISVFVVALQKLPSWFLPRVVSFNHSFKGNTISY